MVENSFVVNYLINLEDDASYSLVNNDFENQATLLVRDKNMTLYFENGDEPIDFGNDFQKFNQYMLSKNWNLSKVVDGNHRWHKYNPNPKSRNIGDCTLRAYCAAFDINWDKAFDIASKVAKEESSMIQYVCEKVLTEKFNCSVDEKYNKKLTARKDRITVNEFAMTHPYGTYILHIRGHVVTCKNGIYWDSWDSGNKKVDIVYNVPKK